ncbi:MAG: glycosyltransferase family 9 protein, partial [Pseudomonadota bacterium]
MNRFATQGVTSADLAAYSQSMRMLFITANRLGDAVMTTGLYDAFAAAAPDLRAWVAASPLAASLFEAAPGLERIHPLVKRPRKAHWLRLYRAVALRRWDLIVDLRDSAVSRLTPFAKRRIIVGKTSFAQHKVPALSAAVGLDAPATPRLWFAPHHRAEAERRVPLGPPALAIAPGANWIGKRWRPQFFAELARRALGPNGPFAGGRLVVVGADEDRAAAAATLAALPRPRVIDLVGAVDPLTTGACL